MAVQIFLKYARIDTFEILKITIFIFLSQKELPFSEIRSSTIFLESQLHSIRTSETLLSQNISMILNLSIIFKAALILEL